MRHNTLFVSCAVLLSMTLLTGCNKATDTDKAEDTASQPTTETTTTQDSAINNNSPTVNIMADSFVAITKAQLNADDKYSAEDKECLNQMNDTVATAEADKFLRNELTPEQLATLDDFYGSELGQKITKFSDQQYKMMAGETVENPITLTQEEQQKMVEFVQSPEGQTIQNIGDSVDPQQYEDMLKKIINNELTRCNLEPIE
ncbi:hypothetical protein [Psychrobacter sp. I-STPA6b]|uniref:hypothetical protein n=1 Tax=Psychrobacter sp. I-STPA6b TaxID=2585718 RepID=UPI001D0C238B|nr:hypothetical protein [Psychrobacter sp. I-STPA6b]